MTVQRWQLLVAFGSVLVACGGTTDSSDADPAAGGSGGTKSTSGTVSGEDGGSAGTGGSSFGGGPGLDTGTGFSATVTGSGGFSTTGSIPGTGGFGTTAGLGGTGGGLSCFASDRQLGGCYGVASNSEGGAAGAAGAPGIDECWGSDAPRNCEASFEGEVVGAGKQGDPNECEVSVFGGVDGSLNSGSWLRLRDGDAELFVSLGGAEGELDVEPGDRVEAHLLRESWHDEFMTGARLILMQDGELVAALNENLPLDEPLQVGGLTLERGAEVCKEPEDGETCSYVAHDFTVRSGDEALSVTPNSQAHFGSYDILTEENFVVTSLGGCDTGNYSDFGIARIKP